MGCAAIATGWDKFWTSLAVHSSASIPTSAYDWPEACIPRPLVIGLLSRPLPRPSRAPRRSKEPSGKNACHCWQPHHDADQGVEVRQQPKYRVTKEHTAENDRRPEGACAKGGKGPRQEKGVGIGTGHRECKNTYGGKTHRAPSFWRCSISFAVAEPAPPETTPA